MLFAFASDYRPSRWGALPLAWVVGAALQLQQPTLWPAAVYGLLLAIALALAFGLRHTRAALGGWLVLALCLGFGSTGLRAQWFAAQALEPPLEGRDLVVQGIVVGLPQTSETGLRFMLDIESAREAGQLRSLPPRVNLAWYSGAYAQDALAPQPGLPSLRSGERWRMTVRLKAPHGARNPHGFDYELWAWERGIQANGYVRSSGAPPERLGQTWRNPVDWARQQLRDRILARVADRQAAGLIAALVVGDQNAIERADWDVFRATGISHLVSISGIHVTMFAWGAAWLVGALWRRSRPLCLWLPAPNAALLGGVVLALAYALFSGWGVPAQRTCWMLATVTALRWRGLRWPWPVVWMGACAAVVLADPWALLQAGFWLSFVAVGVLFAAAPAQRREGARLWQMLREQWVVTLALAPLTLLLFGQVSLVGLVANAIAIPGVTLLITPLAMLGSLVPALWELASWSIAGGMQWLQWLAALPLATWSLATPPVFLAAVALLGAVLLVAPGPWHLRGLGLALCWPLLSWQAPRPPTGGFELLAADVGQGNAVLVRTANHALLYDTGPRYSADSDAGHRVLVPLLQSLGVRLDRLVVSHRDSDHAGGAAAVLAMQKHADFYSSIEADHPLQALRPATRCEAGQHWVWDGVAFSVLHPQAADYAMQAKPNALSCVLRISDGQRTALLVGDIEQAQEARLVAQHGAALAADVLLVPHHGSKTSSSAALLDAARPRWALVQSGYRNRFGHPADVVLERYRARQIRVLDSPHCGAMTWRSWAAEGVDCQREQDLRYWQHLVP